MKKIIALSTLLILSALGMACGGDTNTNNATNKPANATPVVVSTPPMNTAPPVAANTPSTNATNVKPANTTNTKPANTPAASPTKKP